MSKKFKNIPISKPRLLKGDLLSVMRPLKKGWIVQGDEVRTFEKKWAAFVNSKHAIALSSCTAALHLSLKALELSPDDEVIVPSFTWISSANCVEFNNCKLVFCDINLDTFNIDIKDFEKKITNKTKAVIVVHLFGLSADIKKVLEICNKEKIQVIEDAACGFGSKYDGQHVGTFGISGCFSFHARKAITTGEGGMIVTDDELFAQKIRVLRDHGANMSDLERHKSSSPFFLADHSEAGYNYRMTDIQAALGVEQMKRAKDIILERQKLAKNYNDALKNIPHIYPTFVPDRYEHSYQSFPCIFKKEKIKLHNVKLINETRNYVMEELQKLGISTRPATHAIHMLSYYKNKYKIKSIDYSSSFIASQTSISLPIYNGMKLSEQEYVIKNLKSVIKKCVD